eukprot:CAMPEP_0183764862 /NCGR_PEP_ID=MMETSP0739-20130205/10572_1 /TAXON_ID=385413 /ORGANISM="Thalassiosira miniscula, Strain CCMP1093" /LENGTH=66 /DNA_ID=CAMNT_0026003455 /DNA_START=171 /DNA_END=371 /DNA_ORIENTATION=+
MRERDSEKPSNFNKASEDACRDALNDMQLMGIDVRIDDSIFSSYEFDKPAGCYLFCNREGGSLWSF